MQKIIYLSLCLLFIAASPAYAHRLNVFAWLEGGNIVVRCNFGSKRPALNVDIKAFEGADHALLAQGITNGQGEFAFPLPPGIKSGLLIEADAGQGHKGEWRMDAAELGKDAEPAETETKRQPVLHSPPSSASPASGANGISREELKAILAESLAPLSRQLADLHSQKPDISEIIGGIGWIMGLFGITFYFMGRKKQ